MTATDILVFPGYIKAWVGSNAMTSTFLVYNGRELEWKMEEVVADKGIRILLLWVLVKKSANYLRANFFSVRQDNFNISLKPRVDASKDKVLLVKESL